MTDYLTTAQLLDAMHTARSEWEALLEEVGEARLTEPGVEGDWSLKDILAHIAYYERWAADCVAAIRRGEPLPQSEYKGLELDERNARIYERNRERSLADVLCDSQNSFQRSLDAVQGLRDKDLYDREFMRGYGVEWVVHELIEGDTYEHYRDHIAPVRAWLDRIAVR